MRNTLIIITGLLAASFAAAAPIRYNLTVNTDRAIAAETAEVAAALGQPSETRTTTDLAFDLETLEGGAFRITFVTATQATLAGEQSIPDVERLGANLPGRWLEFAPRTLRDGGVSRSPDLKRESEEVDYNLLAFILIPPGGPLDSLWEGTYRGAAARLWGEGVNALGEAEAQPMEAFEGDTSGGWEYAATVRAELSQQTKFSTMIGSLALEGAGKTVTAEDDLPAYGRLALTGERRRTFTVFGKNHELADKVSTTYMLVREGTALPPEWAAPDEINAE